MSTNQLQAVAAGISRGRHLTWQRSPCRKAQYPAAPQTGLQPPRGRASWRLLAAGGGETRHPCWYTTGNSLWQGPLRSSQTFLGEDPWNK